LTRLTDQKLRIIDANLDRTTEGLRVLEDVARFVLNSSTLATRLKELRHRLHDAFPELVIRLISVRDSASDVGRGSETVKEPAAGLIDTVVANARRVEQSLRVLEEISRLPDAAIGGAIFEEARYAVYDIEKELVSKLSRRDKVARLAGLYTFVENEDDLAVAIERQAATIQLKPGASSRRDFLKLAEDFRECCHKNNTLFIVGEYIDIAIAINADGVALDGDSLPVPVARGLLKVDQLIGYTPRSFEEGIGAREAGVDYLIGPEYQRRKLIEAAGIVVVIPA
jgi:thiamine-phosphate pyrophosphorylase